MRRLYSFILTLLFVQFAYAQWPANYGGVMLQGFYWDSYEDTKWTNLTAQADELSKYFDLIWVPNSANC
ncbi:MAG: alpha-amylase, partial [Prevotella sp.]|nr:alpha-amylase [Prevotella sp.]